MDNLVVVKSKCPYCGVVSNLKIEMRQIVHKIVLCDPEDLGCDMYYVLGVKFVGEVTTLKMEQPA